MNLAALILLLPLAQAAPPRCVESQRLNRLVSDSRVIALAEITEVGNAGFMFWSGTGVTKQYVTYEVKDVLKGDFTDGTIKVAHPLYQGSLSADSEKVRLSPKLFKRGNTLLLFLGTGRAITKQKDATYRAVDEFVTTDVDCGAVTPNDDLLKTIKEILDRE